MAVERERDRGLQSVDGRIKELFNVETQPARRSLGTDELRKLASVCSVGFGGEIGEDVLLKVMNYCLYVDRRMAGRAAGNIEDMIIRYLMRYFASAQCPEVGEGTRHVDIGVLFGAATVYAHHASRLAGREVRITAIDPFEGYYGKNLDVVTKIPVDEETFLSNLDRFMVDRNAVDVLKGYSSDAGVVDRCKGLNIISLLIDGDHTYDGVRNDWLNYGRLVAGGGYVLFDDYNNHQWPEVTEFVRREVLSSLSDRWEVAIVYGNSLVLKRTGVAWNGKALPEDTLRSELKHMQWQLDKQKDENSRLKRELDARDASIRLLNGKLNKVEEFKRVPVIDIRKKYIAYRELP